MTSTFKTELEKNEFNEGENDIEKQVGIFNADNNSNNFNEKLKSKNNFHNIQEPRGIKKGYFSMESVYSENQFNEIKNFNSKGIKIQNNISESHLNPSVNKMQIKNVDQYLSYIEKSKSNSSKVFKELFDIDNNLSKIKNSISNLKRNEMNRLIKEFNMNDYERRFKTTRFTVISALIGEDNTNIEINRQNRENKVNNIYINLFLFIDYT